MTYKGIVRGSRVELEEGAILPEGTHVSVIPEKSASANGPEGPLSLREWLQQARQLRARIPQTSDSVEILRQLREGRTPA
ncbi:MAG: hypothetical protein RMM98_13270 [Acidobacteriota bacterium]|nr:hypothetical protein [Blastocatellia bacterium]MDW8240573.1 hypothetical protein [Acidobacteriota bacterium]